MKFSRRHFLGMAGLGATGAILSPASALADRRSIDIGNWAVDTTLEWLRGQGNEVCDLRCPGWNDVGSDALVIHGPHRGPLEIKGTAGNTGSIRYRPYRGWFDTSKILDQRDPAYGLDRLYKIANDHPSPVARRGARKLFVDASRGGLGYQRFEVHGVGGTSPRVHWSGSEPIRPHHFTRAFGSPRPLFASALRGAQAVSQGLFYVEIVAAVAGGVERFIKVEDAYDRGQIGQIEREQLHTESVFRRAGTWAGATGGAQVGGQLAAALMSNPGGWAILGTLGIVGLSAGAGALIGGWAFEKIGGHVVRFIHEMGGTLSSLIECATPVMEVLHKAIVRCKQAANPIVVVARDIARAMWEAAVDLVTLQTRGVWPDALQRA